MMKLADHGFFVVEPDKSRHTLRESLTDAFQLSQVEIDCADVCLIGNEVSGQCHQLLGRVFSITENLVAMLAQQSSHSARLVVVIDIKKSEGIVSAPDSADASSVLSDQNLVVFLLRNTIFALQVTIPFSIRGRGSVRPSSSAISIVFVALGGTLTVLALRIQPVFVSRYAVELIGRFDDLALAATFFGYVNRVPVSILVAAIFACVLIVPTSTRTEVVNWPNQFAFAATLLIGASKSSLLIDAGFTYTSTAREFRLGFRQLACVAAFLTVCSAIFASTIEPITRGPISMEAIVRLGQLALAATLLARSIAHVGLPLVRPCPRPVHAGAGVFCCLHLSYQPKREIGGGANDACRTWI
jgi:hypothetical protein